MTEKPSFDLPQSSIASRIGKFLNTAKDLPDLQMNCVIVDEDEIRTAPAPELDCPQVVQFDVVAGLFEVQKKE